MNHSLSEHGHHGALIRLVNYPNIITQHCHKAWCRLVARHQRLGDVLLRPRFQERLDHLQVAVLGRDVQRGRPAAGPMGWYAETRAELTTVNQWFMIFTMMVT